MGQVMHFDYQTYWSENTFEMATRVNYIRSLLKTKLAKTEYLRLGSQHDGGYIIANDLTKDDYVVSFGVETNIDFEKDLSQYGCHIDMYDYSVDGLPQPVDNSTFFQERIGTQQGETKLEDCLAKTEQDIILKVDIEGSEWDVFSQVDPSQLERARQILLEFHWLPNIEDTDFYEKAFKALSNLRETHTPVWVHANNNVPLIVMGASPLPFVIEVLYLRNSSYSFTEIVNPFAGLETRNDQYFPEIGLTFP